MEAQKLDLEMRAMQPALFLLSNSVKAGIGIMNRAWNIAIREKQEFDFLFLMIQYSWVKSFKFLALDCF